MRGVLLVTLTMMVPCASPPNPDTFAPIYGITVEDGQVKVHTVPNLQYESKPCYSFDLGFEAVSPDTAWVYVTKTPTTGFCTLECPADGVLLVKTLPERFSGATLEPHPNSPPSTSLGCGSQGHGTVIDLG